MCVCVCGGGGGGYLSQVRKKMPNIWISVKMACLVSRLRTRIFSLSQAETFRFINVINETLKRETAI